MNMKNEPFHSRHCRFDSCQVRIETIEFHKLKHSNIFNMLVRDIFRTFFCVYSFNSVPNLDSCQRRCYFLRLFFRAIHRVTRWNNSQHFFFVTAAVAVVVVVVVHSSIGSFAILDHGAVLCVVFAAFVIACWRQNQLKFRVATHINAERIGKNQWVMSMWCVTYATYCPYLPNIHVETVNGWRNSLFFFFSLSLVSIIYSRIVSQMRPFKWKHCIPTHTRTVQNIIAVSPL